MIITNVGKHSFHFLFASFLLWTSCLGAQDAISEKNILFIQYPGFPDQHSTWNDIGYSPTHNKVYVGVTNHRNTIALYEYDVASDKMINHGSIADLANLRDYQWQGKIHSKIVEGPKGVMYFSSDGGESREEYLMNNPQGYAGGYFMSWDPTQNKLTNLGVGMQYESIKDIDVHPETGILYAITYPQAHFLVYDPAKNKMEDMGRLASTHVPRVIFTDQWGNCYYVDWRQRLVKYEVSTSSLIFAKESLPAFPGTPGGHIVTGITAYAKDFQKGIVYLVTYGAKIVAFTPQENGIGIWEDLGGVFDLDEAEQWKPYVPNLNIGENGKLYYIIGGHGNFVKKDKTVMIECDPETKAKKILYEFPIEEIAEATGSDIRDKDGNLYFAGRRRLPDGHDQSKPFMIKFNPVKNLRP